MSLDDRISLDNEITRNSDTDSKSNYLLEYMEKFGDGVFNVCEDCFENSDIVQISPSESKKEMNESGFKWRRLFW